MDKFQDLRTEMLLTLENLGIEIEAQHHEVATAGQAEIDMRFKPLLQMSDQLMWFKYVLKNVAYRHNHTVTFMPKPLFEDNGTGMHTHISIWKGDQPLFAGDKYAGVSQEALYGIGGILKHCRALTAFTNPTTNSYKRLVPGFEAPVNLAYSSRNRSAAVRIPMYSASPKAKRIEFRTPDPSCNGYLAFSAMLMAAIDLLAREPQPDRSAIADALGGVLCRCTGYRQIVDAVARAIKLHGPRPVCNPAAAPERGQTDVSLASLTPSLRSMSRIPRTA